MASGAALAEVEPAPAGAHLDPYPASGGRRARQPRLEADPVAVVAGVARPQAKARAGADVEVEVALERGARVRPIGDPDLAAGAGGDPGPEAPLGVR